MLESEFDADPWLLNTPTGAVDLKTGNVRPARREDYFTKTTKVGPKNEPTPIFDQFMLDIMGFHIQPDLLFLCALYESEKRSCHSKSAARCISPRLRRGFNT